MDAASKAGPAWAPELRQRLRRLDQLEARERRARRERWNVPLAADPEPEGWLLSYLDLVTLMLVMLVVLLALARQSGAGEAVGSVAAPPAVAAVSVVAESRAAAEDEPATDALAATTSTADADTAIAHGILHAPPRDAGGFAGSASTIAATPIGAADAVSAEAPAVVPGNAQTSPDTGSAAPSGIPSMDTRAAPASIADLAHTLARAAQDDAPMTASVPLPANPDDGFVGPPAPTVALVGSLAQGSTARAAPAARLPEIAFELPSLPAVAAAQPPLATPPSAPEPAPAPSLDALGLTGLGDGVDVIVNEQSISLRISNEILFSSGQAALTASGLGVLDRVAEALSRNPYRISVEGHTDPVPIQTDRYPSNWELSTARATSVLRQLEARGIAARRLRATGYADTMPLTTNDTAEGRAVNRRVEVILETVARQP